MTCRAVQRFLTHAVVLMEPKCCSILKSLLAYYWIILFFLKNKKKTGYNFFLNVLLSFHLDLVKVDLLLFQLSPRNKQLFLHYATRKQYNKSTGSAMIQQIRNSWASWLLREICIWGVHGLGLLIMSQFNLLLKESLLLWQKKRLLKMNKMIKAITIYVPVVHVVV